MGEKTGRARGEVIALPRALSVGNGNLLINFDADLVMRDFYYPYVGMMNQIEGRRNMAGFWAEGHFTWIDEPGWVKTLDYLPDTLVTAGTARNDAFGLHLTINDVVDYRRDLYIRKMVLANLRSEARQVRVFFANDFNIDESDIGDTALFDPDLRAVYHYKRNRCLIIDGRTGAGAAAGEGAGIAQFSTGRKRFAGAEGTWRDAEDGKLEGHLISQGSVDSAIGFEINLGPGAEQDLYIWIAAGTGFDSARATHAAAASGPRRIIDETATFWRSWVGREEHQLHGLPEQLGAFFRRCLLTVRTQVDNRGGILAANDSDILRHNRDHYSYVWPRDAALVAYSLDLAGYHALTRRFFRFCERALSREGFLWHKYHPNGSVGSSWHPWVAKGEFILPVQEDETAGVLWALGNHFRRDREVDFVASIYQTLIEPAAEFLVRYRDPKSGLPRPSWDLWEERQGVFTYTAAATYAGLLAAADLGRLFGDRSASGWREAAEEVKAAALEHLYDEKLGRFLRGVYVTGDGELSPDYTLDASLFGVVLFRLLEADDPRVERTMKLVRDRLWVSTEVGGVARYTNDYYFKKSDDIERVPGNPWIICTLWLARWYVARAKSAEELKVALSILEWVRTHAMPGGHLPEQLHPYSGHPLSVAPLTWSHGEVIGTVMELRQKMRELGVSVELSGDDTRVGPSNGPCPDRPRPGGPAEGPAP